VEGRRGEASLPGRKGAERKDENDLPETKSLKKKRNARAVCQGKRGRKVVVEGGT